MTKANAKAPVSEKREYKTAGSAALQKATKMESGICMTPVTRQSSQ